MIQTLIGKKLDQVQLFLENGRRIPVTTISVQDNVVVQTKNKEKDAYTAVQLGYGSKKKATKAITGHVKKAGMKLPPVVLHEVPFVGGDELPNLGDTVAVDAVFKPGDIVKVIGTSKGKGFAGGEKRHGFRGGPKTHGQSDRHRAPGSIGQTTTPGRVYKGKRMAGRMGHETVSITNLTVVDVDATGKTLSILGLVPGHKNGIVYIVRTGEQKKFVPLLKVQEEKVEVSSDIAEVNMIEEENTNDATSEVVEVEETKVEEPVAEAPVEEKVAEDTEAEVQEEK